MTRRIKGPMLVIMMLSLANDIFCQVFEKDPCVSHDVLDDYRRSPLYQPQTPRDFICDRQLAHGWYRFTIQNRPAEMPTKCAAINYCGTQAPLWLSLTDEAGRPSSIPEAQQSARLTACTSWSLSPSDVDGINNNNDSDLQDQDCCAMQYPVTVRNCSTFLVYQLKPTEACNMAYCAQLIPRKGDRMFTFSRAPVIRVDTTGYAETRRVWLNCSIQHASSSSPHSSSDPQKFRFHWIKLSGREGHHQTTVQTSVVTPSFYDLLPRHKITAGDQVVCQVEAVIEEDEDEKHSAWHRMVMHGGNPSATSEVFTAGILMNPSTDRLLTAYKNGSVINVTLMSTMPFECSAHVHSRDCHLSVQVVVDDLPPTDSNEAARFRPSTLLALSQCYLPLGTETEQHFLVIPVVDFVRPSLLTTENGAINVTIQLVVSSYGDAWWHGYELPNITIQIKDVPPVQCYSFTQGHIYGVTGQLDKVARAGRFLLYANRLQSFKVHVEYQPCFGTTERKSMSASAVCICSVDIRAYGEVFRMEGCSSRTTSAKKMNIQGNRKRPLPQMSLSRSFGRKRMRVLESRYGKIVTVVLEHGGRVRIRLEEWGMSVSILDAGQLVDELGNNIVGLCHPDNLVVVHQQESGDTVRGSATLTASSLPPDEFCSCLPTNDAFLEGIVKHNPKCDPMEDEECPSSCSQRQSAIEWSTFFNYLDISDQVRLDHDSSLGGEVNDLNLIDHPQSDSASTDSNFMMMIQKPIEWASSAVPSRSGTNLGRDIHWTPLLARIRRHLFNDKSISTATDLDSESTRLNRRDQVELYCSNFLVNSTVALECGQYLDGDYLLAAIQICVGDVYQSEDLKWAKDSMGLLEDRCEVEATYRRRSSSFLDWPLDLLGHPLVPPAIVEALNCPNRCSNQGVCLSHGCLCQSGFSGSDCSLMDENPPRVDTIGKDGLCDLRFDECYKIPVTGSGFINSSQLACQIHPGRFNGASWHRFNHSSLQVSQTAAHFVSSEEIECILLVNTTIHPLKSQKRKYHPLVGDVSEELHLEVQVSNDGLHYSPFPGHLTLYHSGCRSCPIRKDDGTSGWPLCVDREDVCYLENSCFPEGEVNPSNSCQKCRLDRPHSWSVNEKNQPPTLHIPSNGLVKTVAYQGQLLEYTIPADDPEGDPLTFRITDPLTDAQISSDGGLFTWKAVSNGLSPVDYEIFRLSVSDPCHPAIHFQMQVDVLPCPCLNGGSCLMNQDLTNSNQISLLPSYECKCGSSFTGPDCSVRIDFCDPNPCMNGGSCILKNNTSGSNYICDCMGGYQGITCNEHSLQHTPSSNSNVTQITEEGCTITCENGGVCHTKKNRCKCPEGFTGRQCQWKVECPQPCLNGGRCNRRKQCVCPKGWGGNYCETALCDPPCLNGGECLSPGKCTCPPGYHGSKCHKAVCRPKCGKHGKCIGPGLCLCREGYGGSNCNLRLNVDKISIAKMTTPRPTVIYFQKKKNRLKKKRKNPNPTKITILTL